MGIHDKVNYTMPCPKCGAVVTGFQTDDMGQGMKTYELNQLGDGCMMESYCDDPCGEMVRVTVWHVTPPTVRVELVVYEEESAEEEAEHARFLAEFKLAGGLIGNATTTEETSLDFSDITFIRLELARRINFLKNLAEPPDNAEQTIARLEEIVGTITEMIRKDN